MIVLKKQAKQKLTFFFLNDTNKEDCDACVSLKSTA